MRFNLFKIGKDGVNKVSRETDVYGNEVPQVVDPESQMIDDLDLDAGKLSADQVLARKFLSFLGARRIKVNDLKLLSGDEQRRLKRQFLSTIDV